MFTQIVRPNLHFVEVHFTASNENSVSLRGRLLNIEVCPSYTPLFFQLLQRKYTLRGHSSEVNKINKLSPKRIDTHKSGNIIHAYLNLFDHCKEPYKHAYLHRKI